MTTHAQAPPARLPVAGLWIWTAWVAMTLFGVLVGLLLTGALGTLLIPFGQVSLVRGWELVTVPLFAVGAGVLLWLPVGITQGLVLRRVIPGFDRAALRGWGLTTVLAGGGAMVAIALISSLYWLLGMALMSGAIGYRADSLDLVPWCFGFIYLAGTGAGIGAVFGFSQSALLGYYGLASDVWWKATLLAWGLVVPLGLILLFATLQLLLPSAVVDVLGTRTSYFPSNVLTFALVITLPAAVTGLALPRLMTPPTLRPPGPDLPRLFPE